MDPEWTFHSPVRIRFQDQVLDGLGEIVPYDRVALITTPGFVKRGAAEGGKRSLGDRLVSVLDLVEPNPDLDVLDADRDLFITENPRPSSPWAGERHRHRQGRVAPDVRRGFAIQPVARRPSVPTSKRRVGSSPFPPPPEQARR